MPVFPVLVLKLLSNLKKIVTDGWRYFRLGLAYWGAKFSHPRKNESLESHRVVKLGLGPFWPFF
jgi:hypothetical protein